MEWLGVAVVASVIGLLVITRVFGHVEFLLLNTRLFGFGRFLPFGTTLDHGDEVQHTQVSLQGTRQWEELWGALVDSAEKFHLVKMQLTLSLPQLHENFFATWSRWGKHRREMTWQTDIPLIVEGQPVGRLNVTGLQNASYASSEMSLFIDFVETLESQLTVLIKNDERAAVAKESSSPTAKGLERPDPSVAVHGAIGQRS
jgi:hypothetical protein